MDGSSKETGHWAMQPHRYTRTQHLSKHESSKENWFSSRWHPKFHPPGISPWICHSNNSILWEAVSSHTWPDIYKKEYHLPLKKVPVPETEDNLRGIGMTAWVSKQLERLILDWIWPYLEPHLDPDQMGGRRGCSIEHYIVKMVHFVLGSLDKDSNSAV